MLEFKSPLSIFQSRTTRPEAGRVGLRSHTGWDALECASAEAYAQTGIHLPFLGNSTPISYWRASSSPISVHEVWGRGPKTRSPGLGTGPGLALVFGPGMGMCPILPIGSRSWDLGGWELFVKERQYLHWTEREQAKAWPVRGQHRERLPERKPHRVGQGLNPWVQS